MGRFLASTLLIAAVALGSAAHGDDLDTVAARIKADTYSSALSATTTTGYLNTLGANGRWSDVNYADTSITNWAPATHLTRMLFMAEAYANPSHSLYQSATLLDGIRKAYDAYVTLDPKSSNWWYNEINTPQLLGKTILLVQPQLTAAQITSGTTIIARSYYPRSYNAGTNTGENRQWRALATVLRGAITHDTTLTSEAFGAISDVYVVTTGEGVQPDGSFHQHGAQLYNGGYGLSFSQDAADLSSYAAGTTYAMPAGSTQVLVDYLLDGQQWMLRGVSFEATAQGRGISRSSSVNLGKGMYSVIDQTMTLTSYRSAELTTMRNRLYAAQTSGTASPALALVGHKHFWNSDYTAHHRAGFSATVKVSSTRTLEPESINGEGLKNLHLADGVNLVQQRGDEYTGIQPIWDWRRLPGTTTEQGTYSLTPPGGLTNPGSTGFAGGVSDGRNGASVLDYSALNVKAHKAWFFFDDVEVALGAGIDATAATSPVITTLNQTFQKGAVSWGTTSGSTGSLASGTQTRSDVSWVLHDGVGYVFPTAQSVTVQAAVQSGSWSALATSNTSTALVTGSVFSLQVNHGTAPSGGSYSYAILPGASGSSVAAYAAAPAVRVLANTRTLQAARHDGLALTQGAFYASGTLSTGSGATLAVREPSLVMLDESTTATKLSVSNPYGLATTIHADVTQTQPEGPDEFTRVTLRLSGSDQGGATASRTFDQPASRTFAYQLRDAAPAGAPLAYRWSFEGGTAADRLVNSGTGANATLQAVAYGSEGSAAKIAYGLGIDETTVAMSPQRLGRLAANAGGALLATTGTVAIPTAFTVEALVRPDLMETGGSIGYAVMAGGATTNNRGYFVVNQEGTSSDSTATIIGDSISQADNVGQTIAAFVPGHWYYVANTYTVSGSQTTINSYVADLTAGQTAVTQAVANQVASGKPLTAAQMAIGGYFVSGTAQEAWSGSIDEVSLFGRVLSGTEVQARLDSLYQAPAQVSWSAAASGTAVGGSGTWSTTGLRWVNGSGRMLPVTTAQLVFGGSAGTVTVSGSQAAAGGLNFAADGYTITGGTLALAGNQAANTVTVNAGTATLATTLSATGGMTMSGPGTLVLSGSRSTVAGPLAVTGGKLVVDPGAGGFAAGGKLQLASGSGTSAALEIRSGTNTFTSAGIAAIGDSSGTATLDVKGGVTTFDVTASRLLVGNKGAGTINVAAGSLALTGSNDITLGGDSAYAANNAAGTITVTGGTLSIPGTGAFRMGVNVTGTTSGAQGTVNLNGGVFETARGFTLGTGAGTINFNGGTLRALASSTGFMVVTTAQVGPGGAAIDTGTNTVAIAQPLVTSGSGSGGLTKTGAGTLKLSGSNTYTGTTAISGGTLALSGAGTLGTGPVSVAGFGATLDISALSASGLSVGGLTGVAGSAIALGGKALSVNAGTSGTFTGVLSGVGGGLTKTGTGSLTLAGANTYTGATNVSAGTLAVTSAYAGTSGTYSAVTVSDGATLSVTQASAGATYNASRLALGSGSGGRLSLALALGSTAAPITTSTLALTGTSTLQLNLTPVAGMKLIAHSSPLVGSVSQLQLVGLPFRVSATLVDTGSASINVGTVQNNVPKWTGAVDGVWNVDTSGTGGSGTLNWKETNSGVTTRYIQASSGTDAVVFDDSATGGTSITLSGTVQPVGLAFTNATKNYSITGAGSITGMAGITKSGTGAVTLATANTFTGGVTVNAGLLSIGHSGALGGGRLTIGGGSINNTSGTAITTTSAVAQDWNADFTFVGSNDLSFNGGAVTLGGDRTVTVSAGQLTVGGVAGAGRALTKAGAGMLAIGASTYTGTTTVNAGTLRAASSTSFTNTVGVTLANVAGATLDLAGFSQTITNLSGGGAIGGNVVLGGATLSTGAAADATIGGLSGAGGLVKNGDGRLSVLGSTATFTGTTAVNGGTLDVGRIGGTFGSGAIAVSGASFIQASGTLTQAVVGDAAGISARGGDLVVNVGGSGAPIDLDASGAGGLGQMIFGSPTADSRVIVRNQIGIDNAAGTGAITVNSGTAGTASAELSGVVGNGGAGGDNGFVKFGGGRLVLSAANTITGVSKATAGVVQLANPLALQFSTIDTTGTGTFDVTGIASPTIGGLSGSGALASVITAGYGGVTSLTLNRVSGTQAYSGVIAAGAPGMSLTKAGAGTQVLSGSNTYSGGTLVNGGTLALSGGSNRLPSATALTFGGGTVAVTGTTQVNQTVASLAVSDSTSAAWVNATPASSTLTVTGSVSIGGGIGTSSLLLQPTAAGGIVLSASSGVTLNPGGELRLGAVITGSNTYFGATCPGPLRISGGSLTAAALVGTADGFTNASAVSVNAVGPLTMTSGQFFLDNSGANGDRRMSFNGNVSITGGTFDQAAGATTGNAICLSGSSTAPNNGTTGSYTFNVSPASYDPNMGISVFATGTTSLTLGMPASQVPFQVMYRNWGLHVLSSTAAGNAIGSLLISDASSTQAVGNTVRLGSNLTLAAGSAPPTQTGYSLALESGTANVGVDVNGYTFDMTASTGIWQPNASPSSTGTTAQTFWQLSSTSGTGRFIANGFNFVYSATGTAGTSNAFTSVGANVILESRVGDDGFNDLGSGSISSASTFRYSGTAAAATPAVLTAGTSIGNLEVTGPGTLKVTSIAGTVGKVSVANGSLVLGGTAALPSIPALSVTGGTFNLAGYATTIGDLSGAAGGTITSGSSATVTLAAGGANSTRYDGVIANSAGSLALVKQGAGALTLGGSNSYKGGTTVMAGSLVVQGDQSAATGAVVVASGATLAGTGTVGGSTTIQSGATLAPGASPGTLTFTQGLTWAGGGNYNWQVLDAGGTAGTSRGWDLVSVAGTLSIASTAANPFRLNLWTLSGTSPDVSGSAANFDATKPASWRIANATGGISGFSADKFQISATAANGTGGFANGTARGTFNLALSGSTGLDLVFTPVTTLTWCGDGVNPGGSGAWTTSGANWSNGKAIGPWAANATAVFSGTGGAVTVGAGVTAAGVKFSGSGAYTLSGTAAAAVVTTGLVDVGAGTASAPPLRVDGPELEPILSVGLGPIREGTGVRGRLTRRRPRHAEVLGNVEHDPLWSGVGGFGRRRSERNGEHALPCAHEFRQRSRLVLLSRSC
ncbi:MAG: hypothetical protein EBR28_07375, partial [Planctomycetia bacterium]|nr:hypothetical protein [Planctomycetia bacterium]